MNKDMKKKLASSLLAISMISASTAVSGAMNVNEITAHDIRQAIINNSENEIGKDEKSDSYQENKKELKDSLTKKEDKNTDSEVTKTGKVIQNTDLYMMDNFSGIVGYNFEIYSREHKLNKDSKITFEIDGKEYVTFGTDNKETENSTDGEYYFSIMPNKKGQWKLYSVDGVRIEDEKINFTVYKDLEEFDSVENREYNLKHRDDIKGFKELSSFSNSFMSMQSRTSRNVNRISGSNRFSTAANISRNNFTSAESVIVVNGWKPVDAIASTAFAKDINAPILYTDTNRIDSSTIDEINRLGANTAYIIGGTSSVDDSIKNEIRYNTGVSYVKRISGSNRAKTALALAEEASRYHTGTNAIIVNGTSESDALAASAISGENGSLMIYAMNNSLDSDSKAFLRNNFRGAFLISGDSSISSNVVNQVKSLGLRVIYKNGSDSSNLSVNLAKDSDFYTTASSAFVVSGTNVADGIPASLIAAKQGVPMLLVKNSNYANEIIDLVNYKNYDPVTIIGGDGSVSRDLESKLRSGSGSNTDISSDRQKIVDLAMRQLGKPYVWGASGPNSFDCSGLVQYVYKNALGINLPRNSGAQANAGRKISRSQLKPGDLVYWSEGSGHIAIYIGDGKVVHAPQPGEKVKTVKIWSEPTYCTRIIKD